MLPPGAKRLLAPSRLARLRCFLKHFPPEARLSPDVRAFFPFLPLAIRLAEIITRAQPPIAGRVSMG
jgi:hypothetical protein